MSETREPEIHIVVDPSGQIEVSVHNVQGEGCLALSKPYTDMFRLEKVTHTDEFYQTVEAVHRHSARA